MTAETSLTQRLPIGWRVARLSSLAALYLTVPASLAAGPTIESLLGMTVLFYIVAIFGFFAALRGAPFPQFIVNVGYCLAAWYGILLLIEIANGDLLRYPRPLTANFLTDYFILLAVPFFAIGWRETGARLEVLDKWVWLSIAIAVGWALYGFFLLGELRPHGLNNMNPIYFGMITLVWSLFAIARALRNRHIDLIGAAFGLAGLVPIVLSGSRTVWAGAILGYTCLIVWWVLVWRKWLTFAVVAALSAVGAFVLYRLPSVGGRISAFLTDASAILVGQSPTSGSFNLRFGMFISSFAAFLDRPLLGYGLADTQAAALAHRPDYVPDFIRLWHLHNDYAMHAVAFGLFGLLFLASLFFLFVLSGWRSSETSLARLSVALTGVFAVYMFGEPLFSRAPISGSFFFIFGVMLAHQTIAHSTANSRQIGVTKERA